MSTVYTDTVQEKAQAGERLNREEGLWLLREAELLELGQLANAVRFGIKPNIRMATAESVDDEFEFKKHFNLL